jgi:hypothetical protein
MTKDGDSSFLCKSTKLHCVTSLQVLIVIINAVGISNPTELKTEIIGYHGIVLAAVI